MLVKVGELDDGAAKQVNGDYSADSKAYRRYLQPHLAGSITNTSDRNNKPSSGDFVTMRIQGQYHETPLDPYHPRGTSLCGLKAGAGIHAFSISHPQLPIAEGCQNVIDDEEHEARIK